MKKINKFILAPIIFIPTITSLVCCNNNSKKNYGIDEIENTEFYFYPEKDNMFEIMIYFKKNIKEEPTTTDIGIDEINIVDKYKLYINRSFSSPISIDHSDFNDLVFEDDSHFSFKINYIMNEEKTIIKDIKIDKI